MKGYAEAHVAIASVAKIDDRMLVFCTLVCKLYEAVKLCGKVGGPAGHMGQSYISFSADPYRSQSYRFQPVKNQDKVPQSLVNCRRCH